MKMKKIVLISAVVLSLALSCFGHVIPEALSSEEMDNAIQSSPGETQAQDVEKKDWIKVTKKPPTRVHYHNGQSIELECEIIGSPAPIVEWVRGTGQRIDESDFSSNIISEVSSSGLARVISRLIINHPVAGTEHTYTCVGRSGSKMDYASTVIHFVHKAPKQPNLLGLLSSLNTEASDSFNKVRIIHYYEDLFDVMGSNVVLPCKTSIKSDIYWLNENGSIITNNSPRFKVLPTGELLITNLRWNDMGSYTCVAKNSVSKDTISTFVYPLDREN